MIHNRKNKINLLSFVLGFTMCLALMIGIVLVNSENIAHAEGEAIDTLEVAFNKTNVGAGCPQWWRSANRCAPSHGRRRRSSQTPWPAWTCRSGRRG